MNRVLKLLLVLPVLCAGCAAHHAKSVRRADEKSTNITVGNVQRSIQNGMSGSQVLEALGSPNIVSTDENGLEVWVYDRFATDVIRSGSAGSTSGIFYIVGVAQSSSGAVRSTQRTLTVIIKFDASKQVRDIAYHASSF